MVDRYAFLDPWTLALPSGPGAVIAVAGSGGKTTLLLRLLRHYRAEGRTVLHTQTVPHAMPAGMPVHLVTGDPRELGRELEDAGSLVLSGPPLRDGRHGAVDPGQLEQWRRRLSPDVTLVEAHASTGTPLRGDEETPVWPITTHLAFLVGHLGAVGRLWGPAVVSGAATTARDRGGEPRRVTVDDVLAAFDPAGRLVASLPASCAPVPFLTGLGAFRDMDGMFEAVDRLWALPRVKLVCLAELLGDERRDAADRRDLPAGAAALAGERVYALYPAELDDVD